MPSSNNCVSADDTAFLKQPVSLEESEGEEGVKGVRRGRGGALAPSANSCSSAHCWGPVTGGH